MSKVGLPLMGYTAVQNTDCYTAKNQKLLKTGCNNVVGATLFNVVNNIVRHCYT